MLEGRDHVAFQFLHVARCSLPHHARFCAQEHTNILRGDLFMAYGEIANKTECIIASNRGPIEYYFADGEYKRRLGSGGLVTALLGAMQHRHAVWIALAMTQADRQGLMADQHFRELLPSSLANITHRLLSIPEQAYQQYYYNISNHILWFAQHALLDPTLTTTFTSQTRTDWDEGYLIANKAIAHAVIEELNQQGPETPVIFQDYQLYLAPGMVRAQYPRARLGHVIYIPWPDARYLAMLPDYMTQAIYQSMATNDMLGFQTWNDARNFLVGALRFLKNAQAHWEITRTNEVGALFWQGHQTYIHLCPATLSTPYVYSSMQTPEAEEEVSALQALLKRKSCEQLIVRVDRVEPTKNIIRGFQAYEHLLQRHPDLQGHVTFLALLVPSRDNLERYRSYEHEVRETITRINNRYGKTDWQPIIAFFGNNRARALAGLQEYDVLLVNPVIDGMNLVVKEGALLNKRAGVIILSNTVGAHDTIGEHVLSIAPLDIEATTNALFQALAMSPEERACRTEKVLTLLAQEDAMRSFSMQIETLLSIT